MKGEGNQWEMDSSPSAHLIGIGRVSFRLVEQTQILKTTRYLFFLFTFISLFISEEKMNSS